MLNLKKKDEFCKKRSEDSLSPLFFAQRKQQPRLTEEESK